MNQDRGIWSPKFPFDPSRFPVFYGWVVLIASIIGIVASIPGQTVGVSVFTDTLMESLGISRLQISSAYLLGTGLSGFLVSQGGRLFDLVGVRKFFVSAVILFGCTLFFFANMDRISRFLGGGSSVIAINLAVTCFGFFAIRFMGQGMVTLASKAMLAKWWNHRRGLMASISGVVLAFTFSMAPKFFALEMEWLGWRNAIMTNALVLMTVFAGLAWLLFRDNPEECGLEMDGGLKVSEKDQNPDTIMVRDFTRAEAMKTYMFWVITLAVSMQAFFVTAYTFHVLDIARFFELKTDTILNFFIYSSFITILTNITVGIVADKIRLRYILMVFTIGGVLACVGILNLPTTLGSGLLIFGLGISWGCFPVLSGVAYARYFGRTHLGEITGASLAFMVFGSSLGPVCFSISKDFLGGYDTIVAISLGVYFTLFITAFWGRNPQRVLLQEQAEAEGKQI